MRDRKAQTELILEEAHNNRISEIKIANRRMVEIIRDVKELRLNVLKYTQSDNIYIKREYQGFRRMIAKVLRSVQSFKDLSDPALNRQKIRELKKFYKEKLQHTNKRIDKLIRKNLIDVSMASSLVNDHDNVNDMIEKIIQVCELLYVESDSILEPTEPEIDHVHHSTD